MKCIQDWPEDEENKRTRVAREQRQRRQERKDDDRRLAAQRQTEADDYRRRAAAQHEREQSRRSIRISRGTVKARQRMFVQLRTALLETRPGRRRMLLHGGPFETRTAVRGGMHQLLLIAKETIADLERGHPAW